MPQVYQCYSVMVFGNVDSSPWLRGYKQYFLKCNTQGFLEINFLNGFASLSNG